MSDNTPDFDNMTPEEIMAWMETLAKRQGASEGFTTAADMQIDEIDPDTVVIDEPGYVPYGQENRTPVEAKPPAPPPVQEPPRVQSPPPAPPAPVERPAAQAPQPTPLPRAFPTPPSQPAPQAPAQPAAQVRPPQEPDRSAPPPAPPVMPAAAQPPVDEGALAWLESLAADESEKIFNLDLSDLPEETAVNEATQPINPMTWLEDLARSQVAEPSLEQLGADEDDQEESEKLDPFAEGVNSMEWIETLAKRQGAKPEELTTRAQMNIPLPDEAEVEAEDYQPFSFDMPPATRRSPEAQSLENPADWLTSLAGSEGYSEAGVRATQPQTDDSDSAEEEMSLEEIQDAINAGTVTGEQMQYFLDRQAEQLASEPDLIELDEVEIDEPIAPAELPDWLSELKPPPPEASPEPTTPIDALFEAEAELPPSNAGMPDWLRDDLMDEDSTNLESIFAVTDDDSEPDQSVATVITPDEADYEFEVDTNDPWVEAFDLEYEQGALDVDDIPEWYSENVTDPDRIAAVEGQFEAETPVEARTALEDAVLPDERELPEGQAETVPAWATDFAAPATDTSGEEVFAEMPEWLREVEASVSPDDIPDWLVETISAPVEEEPEVITPPVVVPAPAPAPQPVQAPTQPAPKAPAPEPVRAAAVDAPEVLKRARDLEQNGDLEGALAEYEGMIRVSADLEAVVTDLTQLVKSYKTTPAVYRVLGDGLMRQGKLQAALNTYREALNQL